MKNKATILSLAAMLFATATFAQAVENDDMYFNAGDRAKFKAQKAQDASYSASIKKNNEAVEDEFILPEDYTARNVNPEFQARSNAQSAQDDNADYFVNNYRYNTATNLNNWNNSFNNWYNNPWYSSNYYGSSMNYPYYGGAYDYYGSPWGNPYYRSGWSSSFGFYMGNSWNSGWGGMGYGMSYGFNYGYPYGNSWSNWGYPYSGYGYGGYYPGSIIIVNNGEGGGRSVTYGKRATRSGMVTNTQQGVNNRTRSSYVTTPSGGRPIDGGRVSSNNSGNRQADYYNRSWRNSQQSNSSYPSRSAAGSSWTERNSSNNNTYNNQSNSSNSSFGSPSRSSSSMSSGATRSSAPASSGSNGRSRGRD